MESLSGYDLYERIARRCRELDITPTYVCEQIGTRKSVITDLKKERINTIQSSLLWEFARFLRVSCDWLISGVDYHAPVLALSLRSYGMPMPKSSEQEPAGQSLSHSLRSPESAFCSWGYIRTYLF